MKTDNTIHESGKLLLFRLSDNILSILLDSKGKALTINVYPRDQTVQVGNICVCRVQKNAASLNAVFVDLPDGTSGYLKLKDNKSPFFIRHSAKLPVRQGERLLVQIQKDSIKGKVVSVTSDITLPGKYCVLKAGNEMLCFSDKFRDLTKKSDIKKKTAQENFTGAGFIIRTNACFAESETIISEMKDLYGQWIDIRKSALESSGICMLYTPPADFLKDIRDVFEDSYEFIITDDADIYHQACEYIKTVSPSSLEKLRFYSNADIPFSTAYDISNILMQALSRKVWLRSGAYIFIEPTQALTAIDVNTGKHITSKDPEDEYLKINQEAAAEIARQIRLRNLSGIIIIDFINMKSEEHKKLLMDYLKTQLKYDPINTNIIEMTKLDLVELTRTKIRKPLYELLSISLLQ